MNIQTIIHFGIIYVVWGSTYTFIKIGLIQFPPFMLSGLRYLIASIIVALFFKSKGGKFTKKEILQESIIGVLLTTANAIVCLSEMYLSSGIASLVVGSMPIIFLLMNFILFEKKTPSPLALLGVVLGFLGIGIVSLDSESGANVPLVLLLLFGNVLWVYGSFYMRAKKSKRNYFERAKIQFFSGSLFLILFSLIFEDRINLTGEISIKGIGALFYLAIIGTVLAYNSYHYLLENVKTEYISTYPLVNPMVALFFGAIFLGEPITSQLKIGSPIIILGLILVIYADKIFKRKETL